FCVSSSFERKLSRMDTGSATAHSARRARRAAGRSVISPMDAPRASHLPTCFTRKGAGSSGRRKSASSSCVSERSCVRSMLHALSAHAGDEEALHVVAVAQKLRHAVFAAATQRFGQVVRARLGDEL